MMGPSTWTQKDLKELMQIPPISSWRWLEPVVLIDEPQQPEQPQKGHNMTGKVNDVTQRDIRPEFRTPVINQVFYYSNDDEGTGVIVVAPDQDNATLQLVRKYPEYALNSWSLTKVDTKTPGLIVVVD